MDIAPTMRSKFQGAGEQTYKPMWDIIAYTDNGEHLINIQEVNI